jgi:hypothetical protein
MKKTVAFLVMAVFAVSMFACAPVKKETRTRVKCPACGYEFEVPIEPGK